MPRVALLNLGCRKNQIDGERILGHFVASGYEMTADFADAHFIIVNTCAFIQEAKQEAIDAILRMARFKQEGICKTLAVSGCFSQRFRTEARRHFPEVDAWLGVDDWPALLSSLLHTSSTSVAGRVLFPPRATQYLKISEGCSRRCGFCAIPGIRGSLRSRLAREILREAQWLYSRGVRECILVSQDTTSYGNDRRTSLVTLLELLVTRTSFPWIRLMYLHPQGITEELLRIIAGEKRLLPYFDIPLQHIADDILRSMRRRPLSAGIRRCVERIRTIVPEAAIRTTFIVGYPGETSGHFRQLLDFTEESRFDRLGVFPYSPEEGTPSFALRGRPRNETVNRRCEQLMSLQREISASRCASLVGQTLDVIIDGPLKRSDLKNSPEVPLEAGTLEGRTKWDAPDVDGTVVLPRGGARTGAIVPVTIVKASDYDLVGEFARSRH